MTSKLAWSQSIVQAMDAILVAMEKLASNIHKRPFDTVSKTTMDLTNE